MYTFISRNIQIAVIPFSNARVQPFLLIFEYDLLKIYISIIRFVKKKLHFLKKSCNSRMNEGKISKFENYFDISFYTIGKTFRT